METFDLRCMSAFRTIPSLFSVRACSKRQLKFVGPNWSQLLGLKVRTLRSSDSTSQNRFVIGEHISTCLVKEMNALLKYEKGRFNPIRESYVGSFL